MTALSDEELGEKIRSGSQPAFREIYDRYHDHMYYISKKYVKEHTLAEDASLDSQDLLPLLLGQSEQGREFVVQQGLGINYLLYVMEKGN